MAFAKYIQVQAPDLHGIDLLEQTRLLHEWLETRSLNPARARQALLADYTDDGRRRRPAFIA